MTSCEVHDADRYCVGHQDRRQDEGRHQDHLRRVLQHQGRRDERHQDHQVRQCEEQNRCVGHQGHQVRQYEDHLGHRCVGHQGHQDLDDYQDQDGNQDELHQGRGVRHQDQDGNQDEIHQELRGHLEEVGLADQLQTLDQEEAEWVER